MFNNKPPPSEIYQKRKSFYITQIILNTTTMMSSASGHAHSSGPSGRLTLSPMAVDGLAGRRNSKRNQGAKTVDAFNTKLTLHTFWLKKVRFTTFFVFSITLRLVLGLMMRFHAKILLCASRQARRVWRWATKINKGYVENQHLKHIKCCFVCSSCCYLLIQKTGITCSWYGTTCV